MWRTDERPGLSTAAVWYAARLRYPVTPGTWLNESGRCACGDRACLRPGAHPLSPCWWLEASRDAEMVTSWWARRPAAGIVVPTSREFDVLDVPGHAGRAALLRLTSNGHRLGPVTETHDGRLSVFVQVGARLLDDLPYGCQWRYGTYDVHLHGEGSYVLLPPSPGVRWMHPPRPSSRTLPSAGELVSVLASTCRDSAGQRRPGLVAAAGS